MVPVIAFCGVSRCGKDTAAAAVVKQLGWKRLAFADPLKLEACKILGIGHEYLELHKQELRGLLVGLGAGHRMLDPDHWIKEAKKMMTSYVADHVPGVVISDVRYNNEAEWVRSIGGKVFIIERNGVVAANDEERASLIPIKRHAAMHPTNARYAIIKNNGSIEKLQTLAVTLARHV
jgi:hypothetical protein